MRFAETRHRLPMLDPGPFGDFLRQCVDPVIQEVHAVSADRVDAVAQAAYDVALELIGQRVAGSGSRGSAIEAVWQRVLVGAASAVAAEPERVLGSLTNAAYQIAATPNARPELWIADVERLAPKCASVDELLRLGQVVAWRAGLAHFREGAIAAAAALPEALALAAVRASTSASWREVEAGLRGSEWFDASEADRRSLASPRVMSMVGAFRGFGGPFTVPPRVTYDAGHFRLTSGEETWLLIADLHGATFHRLSTDEPRGPPSTLALPRGLRLDDKGTLTTSMGAVRLNGPGTVTSAAASSTTLAVTWTLTHQVMLVALT